VAGVAEVHAGDAVDKFVALDVGYIDAFGGFHEEGSAFFSEEGLVCHADVHVVEDGLAEGFRVVGGWYWHGGVLGAG